MTNKTNILLKTFTELCEELISEAWVVTDGQKVIDTVLDHGLAVHLCKLMLRKEPNSSWYVATIPNAIALAWKTGYIEGRKDYGLDEETIIDEHGDVDGENSELRERDI